MRERTPLQKTVGRGFSRICRLAWGLETSSESQVNLEAVNDHLRTGSAVCFFNHLTLADGPIAITFLPEKLDGSLKFIGGPESKKHFTIINRNERRIEILGLAMRLAPLAGIHLTPIVQAYEQENYPSEVTNKSYRHFVQEATAILSQPGGLVVISPEGTRSRTGGLNKPTKGIEHLNKYGNDVWFFPLAIIPEGEFNSGMNIGRKFRVVVGQPFDFNEVRESNDGRPVDRMMKRLALLLPENRRGVYR